jgi:hypothetical protein
MDQEFITVWGEATGDHEMGNPLGVIAQLGEELATRYAVEDEEVARSLVERHHALAPHRAHVSPSGLIRRKPKWRG